MICYTPHLQDGNHTFGVSHLREGAKAIVVGKKSKQSPLYHFCFFFFLKKLSTLMLEILNNNTLGPIEPLKNSQRDQMRTQKNRSMILMRKNKAPRQRQGLLSCARSKLWLPTVLTKAVFFDLFCFCFIFLGTNCFIKKKIKKQKQMDGLSLSGPAPCCDGWLKFQTLLSFSFSLFSLSLDLCMCVCVCMCVLPKHHRVPTSPLRL